MPSHCQDSSQSKNQALFVFGFSEHGVVKEEKHHIYIYIDSEDLLLTLFCLSSWYSHKISLDKVNLERVVFAIYIYIYFFLFLSMCCVTCISQKQVTLTIVVLLFLMVMCI